MTGPRYTLHPRQEAEISMWQELLVGFELVQLRLSSTFYGLGVPHGHGEAVIVNGHEFPVLRSAQVRQGKPITKNGVARLLRR